MDAITLLKTDHKNVEQLFKRFEKAGDRAFVEKRSIVDKIIEELSVHAAIEEQVFYPVARATVPDTDSIALESLEEHHIVKWVLAELEDMSPEDERFDAKVTVLIENVRHHVEEEEAEFFPKVRDELGRNALSDLGDAMDAARKVAPTRPHPEASDTPPGNLVAGPAVGVADRIGDTVSGIAQGGVTAIGDVIATVLRRKKPRAAAPTGSTLTRSTAAKVRSEVADATQAVIDATQATKRKGDKVGDVVADTASAAASGATSTTRSAKQSAKRTGRAATSGAKGTATSARRSAAKTKSTAKRAVTTTSRTARAGGKKTVSTAKGAVRKTATTAKRSSRVA